LGSLWVRKTDVTIISAVILSVSISTVSAMLKSNLLSVMREKFQHQIMLADFSTGAG